MSLIDIFLLESSGSGERARESVSVKKERRAHGKERYVLTRAPYGGSDITAEAVSNGTGICIKFSRNEVNGSELLVDDKPLFEAETARIHQFAEGIWQIGPTSRVLFFDKGASHSLKVKSINGNKEFSMSIPR